MKDDTTVPKKPSSWAAALAQLPGFPAEDKPRLPAVEGAAARKISVIGDEDEHEEAQ